MHRRTIGRGLRPLALTDARMDLDLEEDAYGFVLSWRIGSSRSNHSALRWIRPNAMVLDLSVGRLTMRQHVWCVPEAPGRVRMMLCSVRDIGHPWLDPFLGVMSLFESRILLEHQHVVESSDPPKVPHPRWERSVPTDKPTLAFRRWYLQALEGTAAEPPPRRHGLHAVLSASAAAR